MLSARSSARTPMLALLGAAVVCLSPGCGHGEPVRVRDGVVRVTLDDYAIMPQDISVPAGRVEFVARNAGRLTHNLRVEVAPEQPGEEGKRLGGTPTAHPGETVRATLTLKPGTYRLRCSLANHDDLGMHGELVVGGRS